ncbi:MAG: Ppx/GppA phosphatase family protein [Actinomycetota bacterium]
MAAPDERVRALAAVDVGTNSVHVVVARVHGEGARAQFEILTREKEMVRLGSGAGDMKELDPDAVERAVAALRRCRSLADGADAALRVVATSAVREAENRDHLLGRARSEAGVEIEVISGSEEARLIHLGVLQSVPAGEGSRVVVDIGGGSTELVLADGAHLRIGRSLKLGAIRMTSRFFGGRLLHPGAVDACRRHVRATLIPFQRAVGTDRCLPMVGSSGTIEALAAIEHARATGTVPRSVANEELTRAGLAETVDLLIRAARRGERPELDGLESRRADIALGGALVLEGVMDGLDADRLVVSETALREGVLLDTVMRTDGGTLDHLADLRLRSVEHLMLGCDDDPDHARHVARLATRLFDQLGPALDLGGTHRELLGAAALLANAGLVVSHDRHHHHSYYVIRNSDRLSGFTESEVEIIALVARYHRKSAPKRSHPPFAELRRTDQRVVRALAGILRVAVALDRSRGRRIDDVVVELSDDRVGLSCRTAGSADVSLELYTAEQRSGLLAKVLDRDVEVAATADG